MDAINVEIRTQDCSEDSPIAFSLVETSGKSHSSYSFAEDRRQLFTNSISDFLVGLSNHLRKEKRILEEEWRQFYDEQMKLLSDACRHARWVLEEHYDLLLSEVAAAQSDLQRVNDSLSEAMLSILESGLHIIPHGAIIDIRSELEKRVEVVQRGSEMLGLSTLLRTWPPCECCDCAGMRTMFLTPDDIQKVANPERLWEDIWASSYCPCGNLQGQQCDVCILVDEKSAKLFEKRQREVGLDHIKQQLKRLVLQEDSEWKCARCQERNPEGIVGCSKCGFDSDKATKKRRTNDCLELRAEYCRKMNDY